MSDDPFYPSPTVESQKKYKTRAQSSNLCSTGYNQGLGTGEFQKQEVSFSFLFVQHHFNTRARPSHVQFSGRAGGRAGR